MKMNKIALACGAVMLGMSGLSVADNEFGMNIGVTSNYIWRGVTQTDDGAAVSGGVDYAHGSGFYAGAWASNVDWSTVDGAGATTPSPVSYELDLYGGYAGEIGDFGYDAGLIYYTYDDSADSNFLELGLSGSWKFLSAGLNYTLSGQADDDTGLYVSGDMYYYAGVSFDLPQDFSIGGTVGKYDFTNSSDDDYTHYQVDVSKTAGDYGDVSLSLADTDMDGSDIKFFVSWSKSF
ncbi:MAG: hypothetical protein DIZ77_04650 [endosymbiont of Seepiophila jonesi]|uniref:Histidine kinase n=1 Tax=endosymbiont of Lamellibrachia luymesi TaxID=2200907 RepID=A0A370DVJ1_9GAMM|nr:MAG: hypothetical protein DIZ79_11635 [endosymbiont of Lamellibrachia luymesi]RDH93778.1 MAG: hypothetical protein DIZ77_04650 [endosymbiont of Seepiophila jonesi]